MDTIERLYNIAQAYESAYDNEKTLLIKLDPLYHKDHIIIKGSEIKDYSVRFDEQTLCISKEYFTRKKIPVEHVLEVCVVWL